MTPATATPECRNCPEPGSTFEHYHLFHFDWDVRRARELTRGRKPDTITADSIRNYGLPVDHREPNPDGSFTISMFHVNEKHLAHIPAEKLREPILIAPPVLGDDRSQVIIDGSHRAVRLIREGAETLPCIVLTDAESLECLQRFTPGERRRMKLFPGIRTPKR